MIRYRIPEGSLIAHNAADLVIDSYKNNNLESLGLPYIKEPEQLNVRERKQLLSLGHSITETAILNKYGLKSQNNLESLEICTANLQKIGKAYNITANTSNIFKIENTPDLKQLFLTGRLSFDSVFKIRHLESAKYYRKWINDVGENSNAAEVSMEYIKQVKGKTKFFEQTGGKLLKNLTMFGINAGVGAVVGGPIGTAAGLGIGLLETFLLDGILKGRNPSMFIDDILYEITPEKRLQ